MWKQPRDVISFCDRKSSFGMMSSAPLTRNINQGGGGYSYNSTRVLGFPQIHDWVISGLNLMPITGQIDTRKGESGWSSSFRMMEKSCSQATIGYFG